MKEKNFIWKIVLYMTGIMLMSLAIVIILKANIGSDPVTLFISGLGVMLNTTYGIASWIFTGIMLGIAMIIARKYIRFGTVLGVIFVGVFVDLIFPLVPSIENANMNYFSLIIMFLIGQVLFSAGLGLTISLRYGVTGTDACLLFISEKTKIRYQNLKIISDTILTISGTIMGGVLGIGTVISILLTGTLAVLFVRIYNSTILKAVGLDSEENNMPIKIKLPKFQFSKNKLTVE